MGRPRRTSSLVPRPRRATGRSQSPASIQPTPDLERMQVSRSLAYSVSSCILMSIAPGCGSIEEIDCSYRADSILTSAERQHRMYVGTPIDATHLLFTGNPLTQSHHLNAIALRVCVVNAM